VTYSDRFIRILDILLAPAEATLLLATPGTAAEIAHATSRDEAELAGVLHDLYMRGLVFILERRPSPDPDRPAEPVWGLIDTGRLMDSILFDRRYDRLGDEFFDLWRDFFNDEFIPNEPPQGALRVLPVEEVIRSTKILDVESAQTIVGRARRLAVQRCPCRTRERRCDAPLEMCISVDDLADYVVNRQLGREITNAEALAILARAEQLGLVHQTINSDHPDVVCNCCSCCCSLLRSILVHGDAAASAASRFRPAVDEALCEQCMACVSVCHFGAMAEVDGTRAFDFAKCYGCGLCARTCPHDAISLVEAYSPEHIPAGGSFNLSQLPPV